MATRDHGRAWVHRARSRIAGALGALACALLASTAAANGRFPRAQRLIQDPANPDVIALYGTYGLLVTRDAGASWHHVCEAATGPYAGEDSLLEIMAGARIVLRTDTGLARSDASFCGYDAVLGNATDALQDITRDSAAPDGLLALSTALGDDGVFVSSLSASSDGGATFAPLAGIPPAVLESGLTLDVAANEPALIYLSGFDDQGRGTLAKSTDRGQSFVGFSIMGLGVAAPPYIAAVSALDPNRVFVRTDVYSRPDNDFEARETANDSLYFTPDGGQTWHLALNQRGKLYGFALSPDERWVLAGYGDPVLPAIFVEPDELGLYRVLLDDLLASPDAPPWERIYDRGVTCLRWTEQALFACVAQDENGFEVGRAPDASFSLADTAPFEPLLRLPEVRPLECPAESTASACLTEATTGWLATCNVLRAQCSLDASEGNPQETGSAGSGAGGATGSSAPPLGSSASSGMGGVSPAASGGQAGGASDPSSSAASPTQPVAGSSRKSGSCSSVAPPPGAARGHASTWWPWALLLLAARRRATRGAGEALLVALLPLAASSLTGCSDDAPRDTGSSSADDAVDLGDDGDGARVDCGGAAEDFVLGMSKATPDGVLTVAIVAAEPAPPRVGTNAWTVLLSDASGDAMTADDVTFTGWMPEHGHGLSSVPLTRELDGGRYEIRPINLFMPQLWEFDVVVIHDGRRDSVRFSFCVR
jgi:hypothetical protein